MKCKAAPEPERRQRRPTINSALLLGAPPGRGWPAGPRAGAGVWPEAGLHSQPPCRGNGRGPGTQAVGCGGKHVSRSRSPLCRRCSHRWELPHGWASTCGRGARGKRRAARVLQEASPCHLRRAQRSALSPGLWLQAQWGLSRERPKSGGEPGGVGTGGSPAGEAGAGAVPPSAQGLALSAATARSGAPGPPSRIRCPPCPELPGAPGVHRLFASPEAIGR